MYSWDSMIQIWTDRPGWTATIYVIGTLETVCEVFAATKEECQASATKMVKILNECRT